MLPEKLTCLALDPNAEFCAGGSAHGRIYLWEVASGILFNSWDAHYRQVNVLKFTHDGAALISGSDDSGVSVWTMSSLLDDDLQNEAPTPYCMLSDHTLPITDIVCGVGLFPTCRVLTSSMDNCAKIWDLSTKSLLTTFQFAHPVESVVWDKTERMFFAALTDGTLHQINLFRRRDGQPEAIGGAGLSDIIRTNEEESGSRPKRVISVGASVASMSISLTGSTLLVGTTAGTINIYDIASHQLLRSISPLAQKGLAITYLATMIKPVDLVGHVSPQLNLNVGTMGGGDPKDVFPIKPFATFQRIRDAKAREAHEVLMALRSTEEASSLTYSKEELAEDHAFFMASGTSSQQSDKALLKNKVDTLEAEVAMLKEQLGKAKGVNDLMWEKLVQNTLVNRTDGQS